MQHAGAADEHVDRAERRGDLVRRARALRGIGQIRRDDVGLTADLRRRGVERRAIARHQADARALRRERLRASRGRCRARPP